MRDKMTNEAKARYDENPEHYELLRTIVKDAVAPTNAILKFYVGISIPLFAFLFLMYIGMNNSIQTKADKNEIERDYMMKIEYYKAEVDEHEKIKEGFDNPTRAEYILKSINEHIRLELGLNVGTMRGGTK